MWRVRTRGRGRRRRRLASAASQCSLPRCTCTTSATRQPAEEPPQVARVARAGARRSRRPASRCAGAPIARARSMTRASLPRLQTSVMRWPAPLELGADARGPVRVRRPAPARHEMEDSHASPREARAALARSSALGGRAAESRRGRWPPPRGVALRGEVARARAPARRAHRAGPRGIGEHGAAARRATDSGRSSSSSTPVAPCATVSGSAPTRARDDGAPRRHRLERRPARLVGPRGHEGEDVERVEHRGEVAVAIAGEDRRARESPSDVTRPSRRSRASPLPTRRSRAPGAAPRNSAKPRMSARGRDRGRAARRSRSPGRRRRRARGARRPRAASYAKRSTSTTPSTRRSARGREPARGSAPRSAR